MTHYPTKRESTGKAKTGARKEAARRTDQCRTPQAPPEIYVLSAAVSPIPQYRRAHLRNMRGYLVLQWRDGEKVRSFYLGKARKSSPTAGAAAAAPASRPSASDRAEGRRIKPGTRRRPTDE